MLRLLDLKPQKPQRWEPPFFAGLASGYWPSVESLSDIWKIDKQFSPLENQETQKIVSHWNERISKVSNSKVHE